jgi:hypothetical protein
LYEKYVKPEITGVFLLKYFIKTSDNRMLFYIYYRFILYLLTFSLLYDIIPYVYAFRHNFMEDIMDDGDGETCHCMKITPIRQA